MPTLDLTTPEPKMTARDREGYETWYLMPPPSSMVRTPTVSFENEMVMPQYAAEEPQKLTPLTFPASRMMWDRESRLPFPEDFPPSVDTMDELDLSDSGKWNRQEVVTVVLGVPPDLDARVPEVLRAEDPDRAEVRVG